MGKPQKRGDGWRIRFVDADGNRQSRTLATFDLARTELRRLEVSTDEDRARRERLGSAAMTVTEAFGAFVKNRKRDPNNTERRHQSRGDTYQRHFDMHIEPHIGDVKLFDLTPAVLRKWIGVLAETKTARHGEKNEDGQTLSASTIRSVVTTLRQVAKANDVPLAVVLGDSLKQKRRRTRPKALQCIEDVRALVRSCTDPWFKVAAAIACYCGARLGEVASLRWRHIGHETITIALSWEGPLKARYEDDEEAARVVPLAPELAQLLEEWREQTHGGPDDRVVLVGGKRPLKEGHDDVAQKTRSACKRAGLTPLTFHSLRASYATVVADQGLPLPQLQALLGHVDATTTAIYIRPESARAALDPRARLGGPRMDQAAAIADPVLN
ncbi:MAG: site-specific integrase [Myxococcota bacterium]|nr:site-specific integrase [Myxococcota bacterium]